jgi:hypothetical protein
MANDVRYQIPAHQGVLTGTDGNDVYQGSANFDTAQIDAGRRGAVIVDGGNGPTSVTSAAGTDTLNSVETLLFIDGREVYNPSDAAAQVIRLYDVVLGRDVDQPGLNYSIQVLDDDTELKDFANGLISSGEFVGKHGGNLTNAQFVEVLYQNMRGAPASVGEVASWAAQLESGQMTRGEVAVSFANSAEEQNATASIVAQGIWDRDEGAISIANLYDTAFDRLPDADGLATWVSQVNQDDVEMRDIANAFYNSNEASSLRALDDAGFINEIYQNALGRAAEAGGLSYWLGQISSGMSRADVMMTISESAEHQQINAELFQSDNPLNYGVSLIG